MEKQAGLGGRTQYVETPARCSSAGLITRIRLEVCNGDPATANNSSTNFKGISLI
jgi:hypothetical protein